MLYEHKLHNYSMYILEYTLVYNLGTICAEKSVQLFTLPPPPPHTHTGRDWYKYQRQGQRPPTGVQPPG